MTLVAGLTVDAVLFHHAPVDVKQTAYLASAILAVIVAVLVFAYLRFQATALTSQGRQDLAIDPLTRLLNRGAFTDAAMAVFEAGAGRSDDRPAALLVMRVDGLRHINDTWGHRIGDAALAEIAQTMRHSLRRDDIVARLSGGEFGLVIPTISANNARYVADRIRRAVANIDFRPDGRRQDLTISSGLAFAEERASFHLTYGEADRLARAAKDQGGNRVCASRVSPAIAPQETGLDVTVNDDEVNTAPQASFTLCVG